MLSGVIGYRRHHTRIISVWIDCDAQGRMILCANCKAAHWTRTSCIQFVMWRVMGKRCFKLYWNLFEYGYFDYV